MTAKAGLSGRQAGPFQRVVHRELGGPSARLSRGARPQLWPQPALVTFLPPPTTPATFMASCSSLASNLYGGYMRATMSLSNLPLSSDCKVSVRS